MNHLKCPHCGSPSSRVLDSRPKEAPVLGFGAWRRRRECNECMYRYTTLEINADELIRLENALTSFALRYLQNAIKDIRLPLDGDKGEKK